MRFNELQLKPWLLKNLNDISFATLTEVQAQAIPVMLSGKSLVLRSHPGTGKTHAFLVPLINMIQDAKVLQGVIILPTRILALQVYERCKELLKGSELEVLLCTGGNERYSNKTPQLIIATLGRLKDLVLVNKIVSLKTVKLLIIDEADMVLFENEREDVDSVLSMFPHDMQIGCFGSTTMEETYKYVTKCFARPVMLDLAKAAIKKDIEQIFIPTKTANKGDLLLALLKTFTPYLALIFANKKKTADEVYDLLVKNNYKAVKLTGDASPRFQEQIMKRLHLGIYQYVVCSDLAARGIDILGVSHVINFELPRNIDQFIHRIGRCSRYDLSGTAISFVGYDDDRYLEKLRELGLRCEYRELKNGLLLPVAKRNYQKKSPARIKEINAVKKRFPYREKVKPGYKKRRDALVQKEIGRLKRKRIESYYKRQKKI